MNMITRVSWITGILILLMVITGCGNSRTPTVVAAPPLATVTPTPHFVLTQPDTGRGQQVYLDKQCAACHGPVAEGGLAPSMAGIDLPFDQFLHIVRTALPPKPAFNEAELTTQDAYNLYGWLQSLEQGGAVSTVPASLPTGQVLGMTVWTGGKCDTCHGAFAQGSPKGPTLAGLSFPFEMERAKMRQTADTIPEHTTDNLNDTMLKRLYQWLQAGANPEGGC